MRLAMLRSISGLDSLSIIAWHCMLVVFQQLFSHSRHVQEPVGKYLDQLGWCSWGNSMSICCVNDKGCSIPLINSKDTTRLSFPLGIGPYTKCFNLASFSQVGGQLGFSTKPCIQSKLGGLSHLVCKAKSNVFCHCFWASSKVSAFWQLGSQETNLWQVLLGQHCCQFLNHGTHWTRPSRQFLWVSRNLGVLSGFFESVAVTPFFPFFSLFVFDRYFGACCRPDDWIRNPILHIWM